MSSMSSRESGHEPGPIPGRISGPPLMPSGIPDGERLWAVLALLIAVGMATLDTAIANTALPTIAFDLHASPAASVWIVNAYQLAMVATVLPLAALGEIVGYRRVYVCGLVLFTIASLACALSDTLPLLAASRVLQGLGASAIMSVNTAMLRYIYPPRLLGRGLGLNAMIVAVAFAVGPTVASLILAAGTWPWLFAVNVPLGIAAFAIGYKALPSTPGAAHSFDGKMALLNAAAVGMFMLALGEAAHRASLALVLAELAAAVVCGWLLLRRQVGHPAPMLPLDLFRRPLFALSTLTGICSFSAQGLAFVSLPFYFETVLGRSQVETGFLMTPWPVVVAAMGPIAGRLSDRYSAGVLGGIGLAVMCLGLALLALLPPHPGVFDICWRMSVCGAGFGFFQAPNTRALISSAPPERSGSASGMVATTRLVGQTTGAALVALCFTISTVRGATLALALGALFSGAASIVSFMRMFAGQPTEALS
jgi:DHA2 family multidrug resistance protein-like MFS transporter